MKQAIQVKVDTKLQIPLHQLHGIQDALKMMTKENFTKFKNEMIENGITFTLHVWKQKVSVNGNTAIKWWIVDGHGRHAILKWLSENDYIVPDLPCTETLADSYEEAKKRVLAASSVYHQTTKEGLYEFQSSLGIDVAALESFSIPGISWPEYKVEFFDQVPTVEEGAVEKDQGKVMDTDAYKNAAIKQVVMYFSAEEYAQRIQQLDRLMEIFGVDDYSQVVGKLLDDKIQSATQGN